MTRHKGAANPEPKLPDVLRPGLNIVFCGSAAGAASARAGAYYAGPGNKFWDVLHRTGLTPRRLAPAAFPLLPDFGIGLTDMAKHYAGADAGIRRAHDDPAALKAKIVRFRPAVLAFNGKRAARAFVGHGVDYGRLDSTLSGTVLFVLPSTSGAAARYWDEVPWRTVAALSRSIRRALADGRPMPSHGDRRPISDPS